MTSYFRIAGQDFCMGIGHDHVPDNFLATKEEIERAAYNAGTEAIDRVKLQGYKPITMLDDLTFHSIDGKWLDPVVTGLLRACEVDKVSVSGGEMASMRHCYRPNAVRITCFCLGVKECSPA